jgi:hypothetical protein
MVFPYANGRIKPFTNGLTGPGGPARQQPTRVLLWHTKVDLATRARPGRAGSKSTAAGSAGRRRPRALTVEGSRPSNSTVNDTATGSPNNTPRLRPRSETAASQVGAGGRRRRPVWPASPAHHAVELVSRVRCGGRWRTRRCG